MGFFSGSKQYSTSGLDNEGRLQQSSLFGQLGANPYGAVNFNSVQPTMNLNNLGLTEGQMGGFNEAVQRAVSGLSGGRFNSFQNPNAIGAIAGSAAQHVLPQFAPLMSQNLQALFGQNMQNAQNQFGADQFNVQAQQNRFNQLLQALGQRQVSNSTTTGPGLGYAMLGSADGLKAAGQGAQALGKAGMAAYAAMA